MELRGTWTLSAYAGEPMRGNDGTIEGDVELVEEHPDFEDAAQRAGGLLCAPWCQCVVLESARYASPRIFLGPEEVVGRLAGTRI